MAAIHYSERYTETVVLYLNKTRGSGERKAAARVPQRQTQLPLFKVVLSHARTRYQLNISLRECHCR